jgi:CysZ protein
MVVTAYLWAVGQMFDPAFRRVLGLGLLLSLCLLAGVYALFLLALDTFVPNGANLPLIGPVEGLQSLLGWASLALMVGLSVFLMLPVAAAFAGLFLDDVAEAVERRHYPHLSPARRAGLGEALIGAANLMGLLIALNVAGFFVFPLAGPLAPVLFWALNAGLLGREYFLSVALRRLDRGSARALLRRHAVTAFAGGAVLALPLIVPFLNLLIPVLGAAAFTHIVHRLPD